MKPLYKFVLDEETGKILVQEITEYDSGKWLSNTGYLEYKENGKCEDVIPLEDAIAIVDLVFKAESEE